MQSVHPIMLAIKQPHKRTNMHAYVPCRLTCAK